MTVSSDLTMAAIKMVFSLIFVLALLWGLFRMARRKLPYGNHGARSGLIHVLESRYMGMKKSIALVEVPGTILVLGLGADRITLLSRIDNPDLVGKVAGKPGSKNILSFRDHLRSSSVARIFGCPVKPNDQATE